MAISAPCFIGSIEALQHAVTLEDMIPTAGTGGDDTEAYLLAVDKALSERTHVQLLGKTYNFDQPLVDSKESVRVEGCGAVTGRFRDTQGSVLNSRITEGSGFYFSGRRSTYKHITFTGAMNGWIVESWLNIFSEMSDLQIEPSVANNITNGMVVREPYTCTFKDIDIVGRPATNTTNIGFWHDTTVGVAGGLAKFQNITSSYFGRNIEFGQEQRFNSDPRKANSVIHCQGRHGITGVRFGSGYLNTRVENLWGEHNEYAQVQIHSGAGPICINGLNCLTSSPSSGLILGLDPALGDNVAIQGVTVHGGRLRAQIDGQCVRVFAPADIVPDQWHEFDQVQMWPQTNLASRKIVVDTVDQMPILVRRPMNRARLGNADLMVDSTSTPFTAPLVLRTQP